MDESWNVLNMDNFFNNILLQINNYLINNNFKNILLLILRIKVEIGSTTRKL